MVTICQTTDHYAVIHKDDQYIGCYDFYNIFPFLLTNANKLCMFLHFKKCPLQQECECNHNECTKYKLINSFTVPVAKVEAYITNYNKKRAFVAINHQFIDMNYFWKGFFNLNEKERLSLADKCDTYYIDGRFKYDYVWLRCLCGEYYLEH